MGGFDQLQTYMPHGMCLLWKPELMLLHISSDALIAAAYFVIPIGIARFVRNRHDLDPSHRSAALLFAAFIGLCGFTHVAAIVTLWYPFYVTEGWLKAATAVVSVATATLVLTIVPQLLRLPSPRTLQREIDQHRATLAELTAARAELAQRVTATEDELHQVEESYALADNLLGAVINTIPGLIYAKDMAGRVTMANRTTLELIGKPWSEVRGQTDLDFLEDKDKAIAVMANDRNVLEFERSHELEELVDHPTKGPRIFLSTKRPLRDAAGAVTGIVGMSLDITDRKRVEAQINQSSRVSAMGDMASALAHELNQPLGAISMYLEGVKIALLRDAPTHPALKPVELAREQSLRAGDIIRRLRAFVSGGDKVRRPESVAEVVDDACRLGLLGAGDINIQTVIEHESRDIRAVMDKIEIQQVVVNLVRNAVEATPPHGRNKITIRTGRDGQSNAFVAVEDEGGGFSEETRAILFEPFKSTKGTKGMGVGLSLCRTIVESHGGTIRGETNARVGATFSFLLPLALQDEA
ncbi:ATP-binding protein [Sphingomonas sp. MMS24-J45]|uniref:PAS domain-containing sensor histidine kinase n=1 Tax=Sphingomonas sp. MMS24-J45 TaxID=3238806 RepID=UPI00384EA1A4